MDAYCVPVHTQKILLGRCIFNAYGVYSNNKLEDASSSSWCVLFLYIHWEWVIWRKGVVKRNKKKKPKIFPRKWNWNENFYVSKIEDNKLCWWFWAPQKYIQTIFTSSTAVCLVFLVFLKLKKNPAWLYYNYVYERQTLLS